MRVCMRVFLYVIRICVYKCNNNNNNTYQTKNNNNNNCNNDNNMHM